MTAAFEAALAAFREHRDEHGLNQVRKSSDPYVVSENGVLFTVEYLMKLDSLIGSMEDLVEYMVEARRVAQVFNECDFLPGIMRRSPGALFNYDSMDNHVARLAFDLRHNDGLFARAMKKHGQEVVCDGPDTSSYAEDNKKFFPIAKIFGLGRVRNYWNNMHPNLFCFFSWFGRSPGFMGLLDVAATGSSSLFRKFALWVGTVGGSFWSRPDDNDQWKLGLVVWWAMRGRGAIWRLGEWIWKKRLTKFYPRGIVEVYARYYGSDHPISKEW